MDTMRAYKQALTKLKPYLEERKMRPSPVREMVLEQVCQLPQPFTADQLVEACAPERISVATVYNALNVFVDAKVLYATERQRGRNAVEYDLATNGAIRMQAKCLKCGRVLELRDQAIKRIIKEHNYPNFMPHHYTLIVYGECKVCRKQKPQTATKQ